MKLEGLKKSLERHSHVTNGMFLATVLLAELVDEHGLLEWLGSKGEHETADAISVVISDFTEADKPKKTKRRKKR